MKKIGILGGTFNPVHNGHLQIAAAARTQFGLDEIWFLLSGNPPHKEVEGITAQQRYAMVSLAVAGEDGFVPKDMELRKKKICYSWETLEKLHREYGADCEFYFILGEDSFYAFEHWEKPEVICRYAKILVAHRNFDEHEERTDLTPQGERAAEQAKDLAFAQMLRYYREKFQQDFFEIDSVPVELSSSEIRRKVYDRAFAQQALPRTVADYIYENQLYAQDFSAETLEKTAKKIKKELNAKRYAHTIGVMLTAGNLAYAYRFPYKNAMMAGLLHDCAKCLSDEERLAICKEEGIFVSDVERCEPHLLHGKVGAFLAEKKYKVRDVSLLHAIAVHTTGEKDMSLLDKILFVADYIEPGRDKAKRLDEIRSMAYRDLDRCVFMILEDTLQYLDGAKRSQIDPQTKETYQFYQAIINS